jgi:hypothetical protein
MPSTLPLFRFLRQTTELRELTHAGMLTTANLRDALGFSEPEAAKVLGHSSQVRLHVYIVHHEVPLQLTNHNFMLFSLCFDALL